MAYAGTDFANDVAEAMQRDEADAKRMTAEATSRACASPVLFDGFEEELETKFEFHLLQTPEAAIKVFVLKPEHGAGAPHDHAGLWGCYAAWEGSFWMEGFKEADAEGESVEPIDRWVMEPGRIRLMEPVEIHNVWAHSARSVVLAAYNGDLNACKRRIWDRENHRVIRDQSRWEERVKDGKVHFDLPAKA
jgi:predicted metal-dependent enzyme (double-stranded beta helix superfamily)